MRKLCLLFVLLLLCCMNVGAVEDTYSQDGNDLLQELPDESEELLQDIDTTDPDFLSGVISILLNAFKKSFDGIRQGFKTAGILLIIILLCGICSNTGCRNSLCVIVGALGIYGTTLGSLSAMIRLSETTIQNLTDYSAFLLPVMASAMAISGNPISAGGLQALTALFSQLLMGIISKVLLPGIYLFLTIVACECALQSPMLGEIRKFISWLMEKTLRTLLYIFTGFLSISGIISGSADAVAIKSAKAAVSGMVPVVGNILSDATDTLVSSAMVIKNSIGIIGLLAILSITCVPFLRIGIQYLIMKLTTAVSATVGVKAHTTMLDHISTAMGLLLAMTGTCGALLLISGVCFLKVAVI